MILRSRNGFKSGTNIGCVVCCECLSEISSDSFPSLKIICGIEC
jgi:hypothetical protein